MLESLNFKDMWSFNHPHLSMKNHQKQLHQVGELLKKENFKFSRMKNEKIAITL